MSSGEEARSTWTRRDLLGAAAGGATLAACGSTGGAPERGSLDEGEAGAAPLRDEDLDELLEHLIDESARHAPIAPLEKAARVARLGELLAAADVDALLVEPGATLRYLSDVRWGTSERLFALVVLADGSCLWICPGFEVPRAAERVETHGPHGPIIAWQEHEYAWRPLAAALRERGARRLAIDPRARAFVARALADELGPENVVSGLALVRSLRGRKDAHELALMEAASRLTKRAIVAVAETLAPGVTDHELGRRIRRAQERLGLRDVWVLPLLAEGASYPHGSPEGRELATGDTILVDTGGALHDYQSDVTRSWVFDAPPSADFARAWSAVRAAQRSAFETLRPGIPCREVDAAARRTIEAAGYGSGYELFAHRLGHGIGMEGHEEPYLDGGNELLLAPGMTFSDEPGLYLPERFGLRIEDIVVVTADGADVLGEWQAGPESPAS